MKSLSLTAFSALALTLAACGKKEDQKPPPPPPTPVTLVAAHEADATYYDEFPATAVALNVVELRSQVTGFVTGITFQEGSLVAKGKALYTIDSRQYQAAYDQAQANVRSAEASAANARTNAGRYQTLAAQDAVAKQVVDNANTALATAQSQVAAAEATAAIARNNLAFSRITAPFAGRIGLSQVRLGSQVGAGTTLLNTISTEDPMGVDIVVPETAIPRFTTLQGKTLNPADSTLQLVLPNGQPYGYPGKLRVLDRGVDAQTGTLTVRAEFANPKRDLKDGMTAVLKVRNTASGRRLVVPYKAVLEQMGENFVFVATDSSTAAQRKVQLGPRLQADIVVLSGLNVGEKVVSEGVQKLRDGGKITTQAAPATATK